jgi:hypothetical protein
MLEPTAEILAECGRQLFGLSPPGLYGPADFLVLHHGGDMVAARKMPGWLGGDNQTVKVFMFIVVCSNPHTL